MIVGSVAYKLKIEEEIREDNMLVSSWINDLGIPQKEMDV